MYAFGLHGTAIQLMISHLRSECVHTLGSFSESCGNHTTIAIKNGSKTQLIRKERRERERVGRERDKERERERERE